MGLAALLYLGLRCISICVYIVFAWGPSDMNPRWQRQHCSQPRCGLLCFVALQVVLSVLPGACAAEEGLPAPVAKPAVLNGGESSSIEALPVPSPRRLPPATESVHGVASLLPVPAEQVAVPETQDQSPAEPRAPLSTPTVACAPPSDYLSCACRCCQQASYLGETRWSRFGDALYRSLCCPNPCYQGAWRPLADSAFFTAAARPQNQQRFRWDYAQGLTRPDRAEYFWARADGDGRGPSSVPSRGINYDELRHYTEIAHGPVGVSFEYSYRSVDEGSRHNAGFGDLVVGTKTLLFDREILQFAFKMDTHIPQGATGKGLGTGHVSLEPGLILGVNFSQNSFVQAEIAEWIPLGGDDEYAGALLRYNASWNVVLARPHPCIPMIGVAEVNGWRFQDGSFTLPGTTDQLPAGGDTYLNFAGGLRVFFCNTADFGVSYATPISGCGWTDSVIRTDLRFRY